jgi:hypothetical protein
MYRSRKADWVYYQWSIDDGKSWSKPYPSSLPNSNSATQAILLASGTHNRPPPVSVSGSPLHCSLLHLCAAFRLSWAQGREVSKCHHGGTSPAVGLTDSSIFVFQAHSRWCSTTRAAAGCAGRLGEDPIEIPIEAL